MVGVLLLTTWLQALGAAAEERSSGTIPVRFTLEKPARVTVVIEDQAGRRIRNLLSCTHMPAGQHVLYWDGYDEGLALPAEKGKPVPILHRRASPGSYRVRGLTHDGIRPIFEFAVYSPGQTPWQNTESTGMWLGDHAAPSGIVFLRQGLSAYGGQQAQMLVGTICAEQGNAAIFVGLDGAKLFGSSVGYGSWGPKVLALDGGRSPLDDHIAYGVAFDRLVAFKRDGTNETVCNWDNQGFKCLFQEGRHAGLAVQDGLAVISTRVDQRLSWIDVRGRRTLGTLSLPSPRGLAFDGHGRLLVVTGKQVKRYTVVPGRAELSDETAVITDGLDDPCQILLAGDAIYVSDWGNSHQVKVFGLDGRLRRAIGRPGGAQLGAYDEGKMGSPYQMALAPGGTLWVAESEYAPKRISLWEASSGRFLRAIYGGTKYGGGGSLDPRDRSVFYQSDYYVNGNCGIRFQLDWQAGTYKPLWIYFRGPRLTEEKSFCDFLALYQAPYENYDRTYYRGDLPAIGDRVADRPIHCAGRTYLVNGKAIWLLGDDGLARQVAGFCLMNQFFQPGIGWSKHIPPDRLARIQVRMKEMQARHKDTGALRFLCGWSDADLDGEVDADEVQARYTWPQALQPVDNMTVADDLGVTLPCGVTVPPPEVNKKGVPIYDIEKARFGIAADHPARKEAGIVTGDQDWVCGFRSGFRNGEVQWTYRRLPDHFIPQQPGDIVAPHGFLGPAIKPVRGEAGQFYAFTTYFGSVVLMTTDGLLLDVLGGDCRTTPLWRMPQATRGMAIENVSFESEHFYPSLTQMSDGVIYMVAGQGHSSILRLEGFESVRRHDFGPLVVDDAQAAAAAPTWTEELGGMERKVMNVAMVSAARRIDGVLERSPRWSPTHDEWPAWVDIDRAARGSLAVHGGRLYAAWSTGEPELLRNAGNDDQYLFTTGGTLELMLRVSGYRGEHYEPKGLLPGDLRLLVTRTAAGHKAILYRAVVPGTPEARRVLFESPVGRVWFDEVRDISAQVQVAAGGGDYELEVPLSALGLAVEAHKRVLGDIGILRGNGRESVQRVYWNNKAAQVVSDIPSEARLEPANWGILHFDEPAPGAQVSKDAGGSESNR